MYEMIGWVLYEKSKVHPVDILKEASAEPESELLKGYAIPNEIKSELYK